MGIFIYLLRVGRLNRPNGMYLLKSRASRCHFTPLAFGMPVLYMISFLLGTAYV